MMVRKNEGRGGGGGERERKKALYLDNRRVTLSDKTRVALLFSRSDRRGESIGIDECTGVCVGAHMKSADRSAFGSDG